MQRFARPARGQCTLSLGLCTCESEPCLLLPVVCRSFLEPCSANRYRCATLRGTSHGQMVAWGALHRAKSSLRGRLRLVHCGILLRHCGMFRGAQGVDDVTL